MSPKGDSPHVMFFMEQMKTLTRPFENRSEVGRLLAAQLEKYAGEPNLLVLALPCDGVPVAYEVAHALDAPLDVFLVRKLGVPGHEELAMGALAGGVRVLNDQVVQRLQIPDHVIKATRNNCRTNFNAILISFEAARSCD